MNNIINDVIEHGELAKKYQNLIDFKKNLILISSFLFFILIFTIILKGFLSLELVQIVLFKRSIKFMPPSWYDILFQGILTILVFATLIVITKKANNLEDKLDEILYGNEY